jgi:hypothetical protein
MSAKIKETCYDLKNAWDCADSELSVVMHMLDACRVLAALERAPEHHDTHPSHNIKTGGGFAHGIRLNSETLPGLLQYAFLMIGSVQNDVGYAVEKTLEALERSAA